MHPRKGYLKKFINFANKYKINMNPTTTFIDVFLICPGASAQRESFEILPTEGLPHRR